MAGDKVRKTKASDRKAPEHERLKEAFFSVQRERLALTQAMMSLRGASPIRTRQILVILIKLMRLQRANRRATAALRLR